MTPTELRTIRIRLGLTQAGLAARITELAGPEHRPVSHTTISQAEKGNRPVNTFLAAAVRLMLETHNGETSS